MTRENSVFEGRAWFKFNNLGLARGMALKFYTSMTKVLKLKVRKFWGLIPTFVEVTLKKLTARLFAPPHSHLRATGNKTQNNNSFIFYSEFYCFVCIDQAYSSWKHFSENISSYLKDLLKLLKIL